MKFFCFPADGTRDDAAYSQPPHTHSHTHPSQRCGSIFHRYLVHFPASANERARAHSEENKGRHLDLLRVRNEYLVIMRGLGALTLLGALHVSSSHPLCYIDDRPTDYDEVLTFCPAAQAGACCTDAEEAAVATRFEAVGALTADCGDLYLQASE